MRAEIVRCDVCKREHNLEYVMPSSWFIVTQHTTYGTQEERHFCSKECLKQWVDEGAKGMIEQYE